MTYRSVLLSVALLHGWSTSAAGQQPAPTVSVGMRVRVRVAESAAQRETPFQHWQQLRGEVTKVTPDTLSLRPAEGLGELAVPLSAIQRLDRSAGVPSRGASALQNGAVSALAGAVLFALSYRRGEWDYGVVNRGEAAALGAGFGLVSGAIWGALAPTERWRRVQLSRVR